MTLKLNAEKRKIFGKKLKFSRKEGKLPAIVYGRKDKSVSIFVP
ncbi:50S ribosomal protein L25, partial [Patescibacteria group bacterium]|nr:50S ribosomal protein L25 [Patescibacteria group bacterium]